MKQQNALTNTITTTTVSGTTTISFGSPVALGSALANGTSSNAARADHVHIFPIKLQSALSSSTATLTDDATNQVLAGSLGKLTIRPTGQFAATAQGTTSPAFQFSTASAYTSGLLWKVDESGTSFQEQSHEGFFHLMGSVNTQDAFKVNVDLTGDNRTTLRGANIAPTVGGTIAGLGYSPTLTGVLCAMTLNPTSMANIGTKTVVGGNFTAAINGAATATIQNVFGGKFTAQDLGFVGAVSTAVGGQFNQIGTFAGGLTSAYGLQVPSLGQGTNRWSFWGSNKVHCDASDFIAAASGKGYISKDSQSSSAGGGGTARYWRMYTDASATGVAGDMTLNIDSLGTLTVTRGGGATGTVQLKLVDVGTTLPAT